MAEWLCPAPAWEWDPRPCLPWAQHIQLSSILLPTFLLLLHFLVPYHPPGWLVSLSDIFHLTVNVIKLCILGKKSILMIEESLLSYLKEVINLGELRPTRKSICTVTGLLLVLKTTGMAHSASFLKKKKLFSVYFCSV